MRISGCLAAETGISSNPTSLSPNHTPYTIIEGPISMECNSFSWKTIGGHSITLKTGVLPAHWPLILDAGTVLVSVPLLICAGFVYCHCTGRWVGWGLTIHTVKIVVHLAKGWCTATTMALHLLNRSFYHTVVDLKKKSFWGFKLCQAERAPVG